MEHNTYATSIYIESPSSAVTPYVADGMNLNDWTLFSRMREQVDATTWLGSASGYQRPLYYHARHREVGQIQIVEWHCGFEPGVYHHVYPMLLFPAEYFSSARETGTYFHWISFVDPARATPAIAEGLPTVHRAEARSLKAQLEKRAGHRHAVQPALALQSHTVYVDAPPSLAVGYLADPSNATEWGYMLRADGPRIHDEYDHPLALELTCHELGGYHLIEHVTRYLETGTVIRTPLLVVPATYAFAQPLASGVILHRITPWPVTGSRREGKLSVDDYNAESLAAKRILEARAGNLDAFARGNSYLGPIAKP
jgi:hypothetical protein